MFICSEYKIVFSHFLRFKFADLVLLPFLPFIITFVSPNQKLYSQLGWKKKGHLQSSGLHLSDPNSGNVDYPSGKAGSKEICRS